MTIECKNPNHIHAVFFVIMFVNAAILLGMYIGAYQTIVDMRREAIDRHCARYNPAGGGWEWIEPVQPKAESEQK